MKFVAINSKFPDVGFHFTFYRIPFCSFGIMVYNNNDLLWQRYPGDKTVGMSNDR